MTMRLPEFNVYKDLLKDKSGLIINPDKSYLLESRLNPVAKKWGHDSLESMSKALQGVPDQKLVNEIVEAMTTNETSFFRDTRPFELMKEYVLPTLFEKRQTQKGLKVWCAASSSGQEPYSLAMMLQDNFLEKMPGWRVDIKATDISLDILEQAKTGIYSQFEVQRGLDIMTLMKHFTQEGDKWQLKDTIRNMIKFDYFNLLDSMSTLGTFDMILCRNVLIYFDETDKKDILERMSKLLAPDGYLFLGGAETVLGITDSFKPVPDKRGLYVRSDAPDEVANPAAQAVG